MYLLNLSQTLTCSSSSHFRSPQIVNACILHSNVTLFGYLARCGVIANFTDDAKHHSHCSECSGRGEV